jgi:hypothetical protein
MPQVPVGKSSTMPNSSAAGYPAEPVFFSPVSLHSLRPSLLLVPERAKRTNFHNHNLHNFGAVAGSLVLCAAIIVAGSVFATRRPARSGQTLRNFDPTEITRGDRPTGGDGSVFSLAGWRQTVNSLAYLLFSLVL